MKEFIAKFSPLNFLMLLAAGIINAIGVTLFIAPVQLYDSGISGTSILLSQLTPPSLSLSFFLIVLNIPLLLLGFKRQGAVFSVYAIFTVCVYSTSAWLITDVLPIDVSIASPLVDFIVDGLDSSKAAMIITTCPNEIAQKVSEEFGTGLTVLDARGFYSGTPKTVLYVVVNRFQTVKLKTLVKSIDSGAYMAITPVADLLHASVETATV